jgi:CDP-glucose 4,6-dehydratase
MSKYDFSMDFYKGKKVLVTGHTGFKGTWMCRMLIGAGAIVTGYALEAGDNGMDEACTTDCGKPSLFKLADVEKYMTSVVGDIRDLAHMQKVFDEAQPEIVIHMAAQPIVRDSYKSPVYTYETNVMGTVNVLECVRNTKSVKSFVNVTTDKVYLNKEWSWGYRENEEINGYDPYSNSKSCSELVTSSYKNSFFNEADENARKCAISTARAGNVIGGGDFANDRIIPDCVRSMEKAEEIIVRNPYSTRPFQFVLEPVYCYLMLAAAQYEDASFAGNYNVGPDDCDCVTTGQLVDLFCEKWNGFYEENDKAVRASWKNVCDHGPHEAGFLKLDCSKIKATFGWAPHWHIDEAIEKIVEWTDCYFNGGDIPAVMDKEIEEFLRA